MFLLVVVVVFCLHVCLIMVSNMMHLVPPEDSDLKNPAKIKLSIIQTF